jgi:hypothetical protein
MSMRAPQSLLYRYLFFGWLFRDASAGSLFERAAAWRHNCEQARWLATYARRWIVLGLLFYGLGVFVEFAASAPVASALFYLPSALSVPVNAVICSTWLCLKTFPPPA